MCSTYEKFSNEGAGHSYYPWRRKDSTPDVDKLPKLSLPVVAVELGQLLREPALELGTRLVLRCVPWERSRVNFIPADELTEEKTLH